MGGAAVPVRRTRQIADPRAREERKVAMWRKRVADLSMIATESVALFVLAAVMAAAAGGPGPSFLTILAAMLGGFGLVRLLVHVESARTPLIVAGIVASLLALLVLFNLQFNRGGSPLSLSWLRDVLDDPEAALSGKSPQILGMVIIGVAWLRAVALAQRNLTYQAALTSYSLGLLLLVMMLLVGQGSRAASAVNGAAVPYLVLGLLTLALVQLSRAQYHQGDSLRGPWLATLIGITGLLAVLGALIGLIPLGVLNALLAPVGDLILRLMDLVIYLIALPTAYLIQWIIGLIRGNRPLEMPKSDQTFGQDPTRDLQHRLAQSGPPGVIVFLGKAIFLLAIVGLVAYIAWRAFRRLRRPAADEDETRESLAREGGLGQDLAALMGGLLGRFRRAPRPDREPELPGGILAVRRRYMRALGRAEAGGVVRPAAATPAEFAPRLAEELHTPAALTLSEYFSAARYGRIEPSPEQLVEIDAELRRAE